MNSPASRALPRRILLVSALFILFGSLLISFVQLSKSGMAPVVTEAPANSLARRTESEPTHQTPGTTDSAVAMAVGIQKQPNFVHPDIVAAGKNLSEYGQEIERRNTRRLWRRTFEKHGKERSAFCITPPNPEEIAQLSARVSTLLQELPDSLRPAARGRLQAVYDKYAGTSTSRSTVLFVDRPLRVDPSVDPENLYVSQYETDDVEGIVQDADGTLTLPKGRRKGGNGDWWKERYGHLQQYFLEK